MWNIFSPSKSNPSTPSTPDGATNSSPSSSPYVDSSSRSLRIRGFRQPTSNAEVEALQKEIEALKEELLIKNKTIENLSHKITDLRDELVEKNKALDQLSNNSSVASSYDKKNRQLHTLTPVTHLINDSGRHQTKMNTRGSIATLNALEELKGPDAQKTPIQKLAQKFVKLFDKPTEYIPYLKSTDFARDLVTVCRALYKPLEASPRVIELQSPVYVFGDIHGNLEDLHFFADNLWKLGMDLAAGHFLFLGDYVDRGMSCLEVLAYLFGLKILFPNKISLLRGNHETRDVNGWEGHYGEKSFLYQCKLRFGKELGETVWEECNLAFDRLPLAAVIDQNIFCIHGGIPRPIPRFRNEIEAIEALPHILSIMPGYDFEEDWMKQIGADCIWSDPAGEAMESKLNPDGFGDSPRGAGVVCFGQRAINNFLKKNNLSFIIRAHEAHAHGVALSKNARVFTVFSTSKDHRQGERAMAGCILIDDSKIQIINRSPKYKNKYVRRRASLLNSSLTYEEIEDRKRLGLVRTSIVGDNCGYYSSHINDADLEENIIEEDDDFDGDALAFHYLSYNHEEDEREGVVGEDYGDDQWEGSYNYDDEEENLSRYVSNHTPSFH